MPLRFEIPDKRGAEILAAIHERDNFIASANLRVSDMNRTIEAMMKARLEVAGQDPDAPRGEVACRKEGGKFWLIVGDAPPAAPTPRELQKAPSPRPDGAGAQATGTPRATGKLD